MAQLDERKKTLKNMSICRFCFNSNENELLNIFQKEPKSVPLPRQIMICLSIEVLLNDGHPELICHNCKQQIFQFYIFRNNARKADDAFKIFLQTGNLTTPEIQKLPFLQQQQEAKKSPKPASKKTGKKKRAPSDEASSSDPLDVKKTKLDDGTEIITLCISQSDETGAQDESSEDCSQIDEATGHVSHSQDEETFVLDNEGENADNNKDDLFVETDVFCCEYCERTFPLEQLLDIHIQTYHRKRNFSCEQCDIKFFSKSDLIRHEQTHLANTSSEEHNSRFACNVCAKEFIRENLLKKHQLTHSDVAKLLCPHCEKAFLLKKDLDVHIKKHQKIRKFACSLCVKSFVFKQGLDRHMSSEHIGNKPHKCNYCDAEFNTPIRLTRHITTHAGLRPYPCKFCGRTFLLSHHLTRHMRSHYEKEADVPVGQHKCDICSMSFRRKDSLINHSAIHSMVNLKCVICNTTFENAKSVKEHITVHLQGLPFPCEKCDYSFDTEKQLVEHQVKHAEMEYEDQIEKEVISEVKKGKSTSIVDEFYEEFSENDDQEVSHFKIEDFDNPTLKIHNKSSDIDINEEDSLTQIFDDDETEQNNVKQSESAAASPASEDEEEVDENSDIRPIFREKGTKMYQRKGPIRRKIPKMEIQVDNAQTATSLDEINQPPNVRYRTPAALSNLPSKKAENVKVGDKVVKVQKFIISKDEMKQMAKLGILEVKNGQVIMKSPGQPILNAKIKPVEQSDIEDLLGNQKQKQEAKLFGRRSGKSANRKN